MEIEIHGYEKCKIDLQQKEPNLHLLNIILGQSEVHATKTFVLQPAIMLMNHHKRDFSTTRDISARQQNKPITNQP